MRGTCSVRSTQRSPAHEDSAFIRHEPCDKCGSSDANGVFDDGHKFCFACEAYTAADGASIQRAATVPGLIGEGVPSELRVRKLTSETCSKWGYTVSSYEGQPVQVANYRDVAGKIVAQKVRFKNKDFKFLGDTKAAGLYGQHLWRDGGKRVVITEGEIDALSVSQVQGNKWPVVSLPNGAQGARKALKKAFEWLNGFDEIVLMFDQDDAGREAVEDCSTIGFPPGKLKVAKLPLKDANEMLVAGRGSEIVDAIFGAKVYRPDGIVAGTDLWDAINRVENEETIELPFEGIAAKTHHIRLGEVVTFTAGSGIGKSAIVREIAFHAIKNGVTVGMMMLEEDVKRTARGLIGLAIDRPAHLVWRELSDVDKRKGFDGTLGTGRVYLYDHFGSTSADNITSRIRYLAAGCDCKLVILDHLSIVVSGEGEGDERRMIDNIMTELATLAVELNVAIVLVSHLKRPHGDKGHEEGARTSLAQLRGSHAVAQLSHTVIGIERDQQGEHSDITIMRVLKCRFTGLTGEAGWLSYDHDTGRLTELFDNPFKEKPEFEPADQESPF